MKVLFIGDIFGEPGRRALPGLFPGWWLSGKSMSLSGTERMWPAGLVSRRSWQKSCSISVSR